MQVAHARARRPQVRKAYCAAPFSSPASGGCGLPSPGHTTLTQLPGGDWSVDSFFDITYRIDFVGHPGKSLNGVA